MAPPAHRALSALLTLLAAAAVAAATSARPDSADYVIVGAGTAGCALAARLCEADRRATIALLERGAPRDDAQELLVRAPRNAFQAWRNPALSESFGSLPNAGLAGRSLRLGAASTLGGASATGAATFAFPPPGTASAWGLHGLDEKAAELLYARVAAKVGSSQAPPELRQTYAPDWLSAAEDAGFETLPGGPGYGETEDGLAWYAQITATPEGVKIDSCSAYLTPALNGACAGRIKLIQDATVTRILFSKKRGDNDKRGKKRSPKICATGVEYVSSRDKALKNRQTIRARREVISCAGPYGSPKLLQLSGVGPADLLKSKGVDVVKDLPVGQRIQHRPFASVVALYSGRPLAPENNQSLIRTEESIAQWSAGDGGLLAVSVAGTIASVGEDGTVLGTSALFPLPPNSTNMVRSGCFVNPSAFGSISIANNSVFAPPEVDTNALGDEAEIKRIKSCIARVRKIPASFPSDFGMSEILPGSMDVDDFLTDETVSSNHVVGGCAIGSVLDDKLRVHGVSNLRVVDASSIPEMPRSSGPMSSTYVVAEFAAISISMESRGKGY